MLNIEDGQTIGSFQSFIVFKKNMNVRMYETSVALSILKRFRTKIFGLINLISYKWQKRFWFPLTPFLKNVIAVFALELILCSFT